MKIFKLLLFVAITSLVFQGCNKDGENVSEGDIEGTWNVAVSNFDMTINGQGLDQFFTESEATIYEAILKATYQEGFEETIIEFKSNGTYIATSADEDPETGKWTLNSDGSQLTLNGGSSDEISLDIKSSSKNSLVLGYTIIEDSEDMDDDGTNDELKISFELNLTK